MAKLMKAIVVEAYGAPEVMKLKEVPLPTVGDNQVLVRVHAAGVNPVDVYVRDNRFGVNTKLPYTPGSDCAGVVEEVGKAVDHLKVGDRIFSMAAATGTYAEYALCNVPAVFRIPSDMSFTKASGIGVPYFTAFRALFQKCHVNQNESVLVHGASGAVGIACIQLLRALVGSAKIIGTAGSEDGLKLVTNCGAHNVYNHRDPAYMDAIVRDYPAGVNVIVEMLANENLDRDLSKLVAQNGRVVIVGARDSCMINPRMLMKKESSVCGVALRSATPQETKQAAEAICSSAVWSFIDPAVDRTFALSEAPQAHVYVMESNGHRGKVVLNVRD